MSFLLLLFDKVRFLIIILIISVRFCKFYKERLYLEYVLNWIEFYIIMMEKLEWYSL